jgi:hypothetical protein
MDEQRFDALAQAVGDRVSRRRILRRLSALPLAGGLAARLAPDDHLAARHRKPKHQHGKPTTPAPCKTRAEVCAGTCGSVTFTCKKQPQTVDCGSCLCDVCATSCTFSKIQDAIDAAQPGDTIRVCRGKYVENVYIDKNLTLVGITNPNTWVVLDGNDYDRVLTFEEGAETVTLKNFLLTNGHSGSGGAFYVDEGKTLHVSNCQVSGNTSDSFGGGIANFGTVNLINSTVSGNTSYETGGGIENSGTLILSGSTVTGNTAESDGSSVNNYGGGISNYGGTSSCIWGSSVFGNTPDNCVAKNGGSCGTC